MIPATNVAIVLYNDNLYYQDTCLLLNSSGALATVDYIIIGAHDGMHLFSCLNERGVNFSFLTAMRVSMVSSR